MVFEIGSYYRAQAGLELTILLPQSPKFLHYRHGPPRLVRDRILINSYTRKRDGIPV
jgi:hypothetical protein